jgi:hypothetical protein
MSTIATLTSNETGANSLVDINANFAALNADKMEATLDTDGTLAANSDVKVASQKATKTYVDGKVIDYSCRVYQTGATALTTSWVACAFGAENFDTDTMHDNSTNNTRITFTTAGKYLVGGTLNVNSNGVTGVRIRLGGTTVLAQSKQGNGGSPEGVSVSTIYAFTAGQYVELEGYASTVNSSGDAQTNFWAYRLHA